MDPVVNLVAEGVKSIFCFLFSGITTLSKFQRNIRTLQNEVEALTSIENGIKEDVELGKAEGNNPPVQIDLWLKEVEEFEREVNSFLEACSNEGVPLQGCSSSSSICYRYRLSRGVVKKLEKVQQLKNASCNFPPLPPNRKSPLVRVEPMPAPSLVGQKQVLETLNRLRSYLMNDGIEKIGLWGMGGVGKTALLRNLNNMLDLGMNSLFEVVIWVNVSKDLDLRRVQSDIAERLNYTLDQNESTNRRANRLRRRILRKKSILLILDDVWKKIDLDLVGVPQDDDLNQIKIILSTRSLNVCREMMTDENIRLDVLSEEEAWDMFAEKAGSVVELEDINPFAREIAKRCCGLPLAINAMGTSMRDKTMVELWRNAICQLRRPATRFENIEEQVYEPLKLSYDALNNTLKMCFLYCSLYPENLSISINDLITCWVAEGLIDGHQTLEDSANNGHALVQNLKDSCLLEDGESMGTVKMHDVVRDVARWRSSVEEEKGFFIQSGLSMKHMPDKLKASYRRVSFANNSITNLPSQPLGCPELTALFLQGNPIKKISDGFLRELSALRVLDVGGAQLNSLPPSILQLRELRALLLRDCSSLEKLPPLGALYKLQFLDLSGSQLRKLPKEMAMLRDLKELNLSRTYHLEGIEPETFSGLTSLESLDMSFSAFKWDLKLNVGEQRATFDELLSLQHLSVLRIRLDSVTCLAMDVEWFGSLSKFSIWVGPRSCRSSYTPTQRDERRVTLRGVDLMEKGIDLLLRSASALDLVACGGINGLSEIAKCGLPNLKFLSVRSCDWIKCLINGECIGQTMLPNLEHLKIDRLKNMESMLDGAMRNGGCLGRLRTLEVVGCPRLKFLLSYVLLERVQGLEKILVRDCNLMVSLIAGRVPAEALWALKVIELRRMNNLKIICSSAFARPNLEILEVFQCPMLDKLPFTACNATTIKEIRGDLTWWSNLLWPDVETKDSLQQRFQACNVDSTLMGEHSWALKMEERMLKSSSCLSPALCNSE